MSGDNNSQFIVTKSSFESEANVYLTPTWSSSSTISTSFQSSDLGDTLYSIETEYSFRGWVLRQYDFSTLPKNVLIRIFSYLTEIEIGRSVLRVCRNWRTAAKDSSLWKKLSFSNDEVDVSIICRVLRNSPKLECLKLNFISNVKTIIRQLCRCNTNIKHLAIRYCSKNGILPERVLRNVLISCRQLQTIDLKGTQFHSKRFYEDLASCKHLRSVNFGENPRINIHDIFTLVLNCHSIEELKLTQNIRNKDKLLITNEDAIFLFSNLATTLRVLKIDCRELLHSGYESILKCSKLEHLSLMNAMHFSSILFRNLSGYLPKLKSFKLIKAPQISTGDFVHLFTDGKDVMKNLNVIDVSDSWKLTDRGLSAIANCCNKNLHKLVLTNCKNIENLTSILRECKNLRYLNIAHCAKLNTSNIAHIPKYLSKLQTLVTDIHSDNFPVLKSISSCESIRILVSLSEYNKDKHLFYGQEIV